MPGKWGGARRARPPLDPPMVRHAHTEGGNQDLAHERKEIHKISKFLSNHGTFQYWSSMSYISNDFWLGPVQTSSSQFGLV